jgi:hypothetical protein
MRSYRVAWVIDIEAEDAVEAALRAQEIQRDPDSEASFFEVTDTRTSLCQTVDLLGPERDERLRTTR